MPDRSVDVNVKPYSANRWGACPAIYYARHADYPMVICAKNGPASLDGMLAGPDPVLAGHEYVKPLVQTLMDGTRFGVFDLNRTYKDSYPLQRSGATGGVAAGDRNFIK
jgi:hypothetical protein